MHLGDKLKLYRKAKDLDQLQMAELLSISERTYRGIEKSGIVTKAKDLALIRKILAETTGKSQESLDTTLPLGDMKITLRDYFDEVKQRIDEIKQDKAFLQALLKENLGKVAANLEIVVGKAEGIQLDLISARQTSLKSLARLESKHEMSLLKESDNLKNALAVKADELGKRVVAGK